MSLRPSWGGVVMVPGVECRHVGWRAQCAAFSAAAVLVMAGCSSSTATKAPAKEDSADASTADTREAATSRSVSATDTARKRATAAYLGMWRDMAEAARTSDWKSPVLARYATGEALEAITRGMYADHRNGLVTKGTPRNSPRITELAPTSAPTEAVLSDCGDSSHWLKYRKKDGRLADDEPGGRQSITAEVKKRDDGAWKVTRFAVWEVGSC
ncbi:hypothetical protein [Streptomyces longispororuber]|uniref:hypothetical protein n=1 Tax=Streptomyces longispororuber TaxID=68230 RepID=UPI0036FBDBB4